ncbi:MAG: ATP phosphoribosyltransferase regulatory subunit [Caulobacteraceae bacterium]
MRRGRPIPEEVLAAIRAPFGAEGAVRLEAAVVQPLGLYLDLAGESLRERLVAVALRDGEEGCLRPDFTVAAVLAWIAEGAAPARYFYEGATFHSAPEAGSDTSPGAEEFQQTGLEVFERAEQSPAEAAKADAAMAALAWRAASAGGRDDLSLVMGDVSLFRRLMEALAIASPTAARLSRAFADQARLGAELARLAEEATPQDRAGERLGRLLSSLPPQQAAEVLEDIWVLAGIEPVGGRSAAEIAERLAAKSTDPPGALLERIQVGSINQYLAIAGKPREAFLRLGALDPAGPLLADALEGWRERLAEMERCGIDPDRVRFEAGFARPFGYYDGVLFEVRSEALGPAAPLAAGGRYDSLPSRLGGPSARALGCMVRPDRAWRDGKA